MKIRNISFLFLLFFFQQGLTQVGTGLVLNQEQYEFLDKLPLSFGRKSSLPEKSSLKQFCPSVQHQGQISSCAAWAVGYSALTIMKASQQDWTQMQIDSAAFSAMYIYKM